MLSDHEPFPRHPSAIHHIEDFVPEIVSSPDAMSDGAFPSRAQSPARACDSDVGMGSRDGEQSGELKAYSANTSPFPLQGPIVLSSTIAKGQESHGSKVDLATSDASTTTVSQHERTSSASAEEADVKHLEQDKTSATHFQGVRAAPASPSPSHGSSPAVSRRASSQALPTSANTIQIMQNGKLVDLDTEPDSTPTDTHAASLSQTVSVPARSRDRSGSTSGSNTPTSAASGGSTRTRRPSTLIPQPGREGETIPPRYRVDGVELTGDDQAQQKPVGDMRTEEEPTSAIGQTESKDALTGTLDGDAARTPNDVEQQDVEQETPRQPRVIVRDFGFTPADPRHRGAFHPIPGELEDEEDDEDDDRSTAGSTASGASSGWNRFAGGARRKSSFGGWSGFGFGGFGFGGLSRRFSKSSRRGSQAGLSSAGGAAGDDAESTRSGGGSRRSSLQVGSAAGDAVSGTTKSPAPGGIILPPLPHDTDVSLSDLTPSSSVDDEPPFGRQYVFGADGGSLLKRGNSASGSRLRALSGAGNQEPTTTTPLTIPEGTRVDTFATPGASATADNDPRLSILSQVSEEAHSATSDASGESEAAKWPSDSTVGASSVSSGTTITAREPRGRYKVLYEFEAEGEHEMSVAEGEVLLVGGRWGNMGWVIAERIHVEEGEQVTKGLVPEDYLGEKLGDR